MNWPAGLSDSVDGEPLRNAAACVAAIGRAAISGTLAGAFPGGSFMMPVKFGPPGARRDGGLRRLAGDDPRRVPFLGEYLGYARRAFRAPRSGANQQTRPGTPTPPLELPVPQADSGDHQPPRPVESAQGSFWSLLTAAERDIIMSSADERTFAGGATLMEEGETADHVIVICAGRTKICVIDDGAERVLAHRGPGDLVGERAALRVSVRSASVVALEQVRALVLTTEKFAAFLSDRPAVLHRVEGQVYERLREDRDRHQAGHLQPLRGQNCTVVFSDVVGFGSPARTDEHRRIIRQSVFEMTAESLKQAWDQCSCEDRGDGLLIVAWPHIPTGQVLEHLLSSLPAALKRHNDIYGDGAHIQLRVALDVGPVSSDARGVSGQVIINAARLLDAPPLKEAIADNHADLGIVVSDFVYQTAIRLAGGLSDPGAYTEITSTVKESSLRAWMQFIGVPLAVPAPRRALLATAVIS